MPELQGPLTNYDFERMKNSPYGNPIALAVQFVAGVQLNRIAMYEQWQALEDAAKARGLIRETDEGLEFRVPTGQAEEAPKAAYDFDLSSSPAPDNGQLTTALQNLLQQYAEIESQLADLEARIAENLEAYRVVRHSAAEPIVTGIIAARPELAEYGEELIEEVADILEAHTPVKQRAAEAKILKMADDAKASESSIPTPPEMPSTAASSALKQLRDTSEEAIQMRAARAHVGAEINIYGTLLNKMLAADVTDPYATARGALREIDRSGALTFNLGDLGESFDAISQRMGALEQEGLSLQQKQAALAEQLTDAHRALENPSAQQQSDTAPRPDPSIAVPSVNRGTIPKPKNPADEKDVEPPKPPIS